MKKIIFLLFPLLTLAQNPTNFPYGIKNPAATSDSAPAYFTTTQVDGVHKKTPAALIAFKSDLPVSYAIIVYVNDISPLTATIFDDENPPTTNDNALKTDADNLYIGTDASTWVYNGSTYITKTVPASSNFKIVGTGVDAGSNKTSSIYREGAISSDGSIGSNIGYYVNRNGSNTAQIGGFTNYSNAIGSNSMMFQLNASNGLDLWNYASSTWTKRFTFSSGGDLTAATYNGYTPENSSNKQNDLTVDGTGVKYPTVDAVNADVVKLLGNQTISDKKAFNKISVGTPTSDVIGHPSDSFNADLSIKGSGVRIENTTGESLIVNTTAYAGGSHFYDANVLAIQNKSTYLGSLSEVPSAIRFLSNTDGEMGAIGYQNGAVGTAFANSMFLAASMPYYPSNPIVAPTRLALIQEGDYLGALTKIERLEFNSDWSTKFKTPNGTTRLMIPVSGRVLVNTTTDNGVDDFQVNGIIKATTLKGNSLTSNLVLKATTNGQITNSTISDNGTNVGIGNNSTSPAENLEVRTTGNTGFAMTRNASTNAARFYFRTGSTYNWSVGIRSNRNDYSVYNEVLGVEPLTINSTTSNVLIGSTTDNAVDKLQVTGTASSGTTTLGNTPPTVNNQLTRKDYVDTGLALKAPLSSPTFTGTPTAPTATAGTNTTQIATTAFVLANSTASSGTFTPAAVGAITFDRCYWIKNGNVLDVVYNFSITGNTSYSATMTLPNSFTINANSNGREIGGGKITTNSGYSRVQETATSSDIFLSIVSENTGAASGFARASVLIN